MATTRHLYRLLGLTAILLSTLLWSGCGDVFRPVVFPIPPTPPDPRNAHIALAITNNGNFNPGSIMLIDVSGDTTSGIGNAGIGPSYAAFIPPNASHIVVANAVDNSLTSVSTSGLGSGLTAPTTITLAPNFSLNPVFVDSTENDLVYVANQGAQPSASLPAGLPPSVAVVSLLTNTVTNVINLATITPGSLLSLAETADARKVYFASELNTATPSGAVTSINTVDKTVNSPLITDPSINQPVSIVARSDSARVYVLSQANGDLATINTFTDTLIVPAAPVSVGAGADFMLYDAHLNRLYVTNSALGTLTIFDATADPPNVLASLSLPAGANPSCPNGCASVAALPDGSRAYVTSLQQKGSNEVAQVTAVNTSNNSIVGTVTLPGAPSLANCAGTRFRVSSAAAADSSRVYVGNCDAGNIAIIRTLDNSLISLPAPVSAADAVKVNITSAAQNGSETIFSYNLVSGAGLQVGMSIAITGIGNTVLSFKIGGLGAGTFSVLNPNGTSAATLSATGLALPLQNPVFVLRGP